MSSLFHIRRIGRFNAERFLVSGDVLLLKGMNTYNRYLWEEPLLTAAGPVPFASSVMGKLGELGQYQLHKAMSLRLSKQLVEHVFETVRKDSFPAHPSRLYCLFASSTEADALAWLRVFGKSNPYQLLELSVLEASQTFVGDSRWIHYDTCPIRKIEEFANRYWSGQMTPNPQPEILIVGQTLVRKEIEREGQVVAESNGEVEGK